MPHLVVPRRPCPQILHLASQLQALALGPAATQFRPFVKAVTQPSSCTVLLVLTPEHMLQLDHSARARVSLHD